MRLVIVFFACLATVTPFALGQTLTPMRILHPNGEAFDSFGQSIAVDGDTLVVGAPSDRVGNNSDQGTAHVFRKVGEQWVFEATLIANDGAQQDTFGACVAIHNGMVLVGSPGDDIATNTNQGSVYVFSRASNSWTQQQKLVASDGRAGEYLGGVSLSIFQDTLVIGSQSHDILGDDNVGAVYVFVRSGASWVEHVKLMSPDLQQNTSFGNAVAVVDGLIAVGAPSHDVDPSTNDNMGAVFLYARQGEDWILHATLRASDRAPVDCFGYSVALHETTLFVGAPLDDIFNDGDNRGSAYAFDLSGTNVVERQKLFAAPFDSSAWFGGAVSFEGDMAIIGAPDSAQSRGAAFLYSLCGQTWSFKTGIYPPQDSAIQGDYGQSFGFVVAISNRYAFVGSYRTDVGSNRDQGAAWIYSTENLCRAPAIVNPPDSQVVCAGTELALTVTATATAAECLPQYQWRKNQVPITGATSSTFSLASAMVRDSGIYDCLISNSCGTVVSPAANVVVRIPQLLSQPVSQNVGVDQPVAFAVETNPASPCDTTLAFQWQRRNPLVLDGAAPDAWIDLVSGGGFVGVNAPSLIILRPTPGLATGYRCRISNACGCEADASGVIYTDTVNYSAACPSDFNLDGSVDGDDVIMFFERWDAGC